MKEIHFMIMISKTQSLVQVCKKLYSWLLLCLSLLLYLRCLQEIGSYYSTSSLLLSWSPCSAAMAVQLMTNAGNVWMQPVTLPKVLPITSWLLLASQLASSLTGHGCFGWYGDAWDIHAISAAVYMVVISYGLLWLTIQILCKQFAMWPMMSCYDYLLT